MKIETVNLNKDNSVDSFYLSLQSLINISKSFQRRCRDSNHFPHNYLDEVCSIYIKGPRGSGHTSSVLDYIIRNKLDSVFITHTSAEKYRVTDVFRSKLLKRKLEFSQENPFTVLSEESEVYTVGFNAITSEENKGFTINTQAVIVDNYSLIKNRDSLMRNLEVVIAKARSYSQAYKRDFFYITLN